MILKTSTLLFIVEFFNIYLLFAKHIERKCFNYSNPNGLFHGYIYELTFSIKDDTVELQCRTCDGSYPLDTSNTTSVIWASVNLSPMENETHFKPFKIKSRKFKKHMTIDDNNTLIIKKVKTKNTGLFSCNITTLQPDNTTSIVLVNYFMEVLSHKTEIRVGTLTDWIEYRNEVLDRIDYKLTEESLMGQDGHLKIFWGSWGHCLCGAYKFDTRKYRAAYPYVWVNDSQKHQPIFPTWSKKYENIYPFFASITMNATIFKQNARCTEDCVPDILDEDDAIFRYMDTAYIKESASVDFTCPDTGNESEVLWVLNNEIMLNKTDHALGTGEEEKHVGVDTEDILHLNNLKKRNAGVYACLVDGFPMKSIEVMIIPKFILFTEEGQDALQTVGIVLFFCFILWTIILVLKACFMVLTDTGEPIKKRF